jgi:hypothetical protein
MLRVAGVWLGVLLLSASLANAQQLTIKITKPAEGESVGDLAEVEGKVSDKKVKVWIIVRPLETTEYWVQGDADVNADGAWSGQAHIGRPGDDFRKRFAIRVVANPKAELHKGQVLTRWPAAEASSDVVKITKGE